MSSDVVLSAALRNNLLSLQNTQKGIDASQLKLSTGRKVNSALDNPQSFFASQALTNRAADLTKLLDSIGQSIEVIKAADNGVTALTSLVNQAQAIAQSAQTAVSSTSATAAATGNIALDSTAKLSTLNGFVAGAGEKLLISVTDTNGVKLFDGTSGHGLVTVTPSETIGGLVQAINDLNTTNTTVVGSSTLSAPIVKASLDSQGNLKFEAVNGGSLHVEFQAATSNPTNNLTVATALGFGLIARDNAGGAAATNDTIDFTVSASSSITSNALYSSSGTLAQATTLISKLKDSAGTAINNITAAGDTLNLKIGNKTSGDLLNYTPPGQTALTALTASVQSVVDAINHDSSINTLVSASFDTTTGKIAITAIDPSATDVQFQFGGASGQSFSVATTANPTGIGFGTQILTTAGQTKAQETVRFGAAAGQLASLQTQYNGIRDQIDALVTNGDTGYQGVNLLKGDNLVTTFNEQRTSALTTSGVTFTASGLGIKAANFSNASSVNASLTQISAALNTVRDFGSSLASDLSVIQTRQTFATSLISTLQAGSDALVNADQNEEGAKLLALQTRQSLGVTALSLASQSQQSILRLFQ